MKKSQTTKPGKPRGARPGGHKKRKAATFWPTGLPLKFSFDDTSFIEPRLTAGRQLVPQIGFGCEYTGHCGGCVFVKHDPDRNVFIVAAHLKRGGWQVVRNNVPDIDSAIRIAEKMANSEPNVGPAEGRTAPSNDEHHFTQRPSVIQSQRREALNHYDY